MLAKLNETGLAIHVKRDATCHPVTSGILQLTSLLDEKEVLVVTFGDVQTRCAGEETASDEKRKRSCSKKQARWEEHELQSLPGRATNGQAPGEMDVTQCEKMDDGICVAFPTGATNTQNPAYDQRQPFVKLLV